MTPNLQALRTGTASDFDLVAVESLVDQLRGAFLQTSDIVRGPDGRFQRATADWEIPDIDGIADIVGALVEAERRRRNGA